MVGSREVQGASIASRHGLLIHGAPVRLVAAGPIRLQAVACRRRGPPAATVALCGGGPPVGLHVGARLHAGSVAIREAIWCVVPRSTPDPQTIA